MKTKRFKRLGPCKNGKLMETQYAVKVNALIIKIICGNFLGDFETTTNGLEEASHSLQTILVFGFDMKKLKS